MSLQEKMNSRFSWVISIILLIVVLYQVFWSLNKGMNFSDEAFFAFHTVSGIAKSGITYWDILYSPFILDNYLHTKYLLVVLISISTFLMGYGASSYLKFSLSPGLIGIWCVITQFTLFSPAGIGPGHNSINIIIFNSIVVSLSFFLLYKKNIFLFLVGFFFACLTFVMITNNIFIVPLLLFLFLNDKKLFWKQIIWVGLGGLTLFSIYFIFLQSPQEFISGILIAIEALNYDKDHGSSGIIIWHKIIIWNISIPLLIIVIASTKLSRLPWAKYTLLVASLLFLVYTIYNIITHNHTIFPVLSFYFLAGFIFIYTLQNKITIKTFFAIFLLILPYFASFGTDVNFFVRAVFYFPFILVGCLYLGSQLNSKRGNLLISTFMVIVLIAIITFFNYPYRTSWDGKYKLIEQDQAFEFKGSTLYFDKARIEILNEAYPYLKGEENVLVSHPILWGYVFLLDAKPPLLYYKFNDNVLQYIEENNISKQKLILLEHHKYPFKKEMIEKFIGDEFILKKTELSDFNVLTFETSNKFNASLNGTKDDLKSSLRVVKTSDFEYSVYDKPAGAYYRRSAFAVTKVNTDASSLSVNFYSPLAGGNSQFVPDATISVYNENWVFVDSIVPSVTGALQTKTVALNGSGVRDFYLVESGNTIYGFSEFSGTYIQSIDAVDGFLGIRTIPKSSNRIILVGDSIAIGDGSTLNSRDGWAVVLRNLTRALDWSITLDGWGAAYTNQIAGNATDQQAMADRAIAEFSGATGRKVILWTLGTNDFVYVVGDPTVVATNAACVWDKAYAQDNGIEVMLITPIWTSYQNTVNSGDWVLQDYRDALTAAAVSRPFVTAYDGESILIEADFTADGVHPNNAGHQKLAEYIKEIL